MVDELAQARGVSRKPGYHAVLLIVLAGFPRQPEGLFIGAVGLNRNILCGFLADFGEASGTLWHLFSSSAGGGTPFARNQRTGLWIH
jgi:hypothetical protein